MEKLYKIVRGFNKAFPGGDEPFKIMTRLAEECGEVAQEINHWERVGVKVKKHGEPSKESLAKEVQHVITCALSVASYYGVKKELDESIEKTFEDLKSKGFID